MKIQTVTIDFDDTLYTKCFARIAENRLNFFKTMINSGVFRTIVVTARKANIHEIVEFCEQHDIKIDGIVHNAGDKLKILQELESIAHFEDSDKLVPFLSENGINCFYMGEYLSNSLKVEWKENLEKQDVWKYYVLDNNTRGL